MAAVQFRFVVSGARELQDALRQTTTALRKLKAAQRVANTEARQGTSNVARQRVDMLMAESRIVNRLMHQYRALNRVRRDGIQDMIALKNAETRATRALNRAERSGGRSHQLSRKISFQKFSRGMIDRELRRSAFGGGRGGGGGGRGGRGLNGWGMMSAGGAPLRIGMSAFGRFGGVAGSLFGSVGMAGRYGGLAGAAGVGAGGALAMSALAAGAAVRGGVSRSMDLQDVATSLSMQGQLRPGGTTTSPGSVAKALRQTAIRNPGVDAALIGEAGEKFVEKTGDLGKFMKMTDSIATIMQTSGAEASDVGALAGYLTDAQDWAMGPEAAEKAMATLVYQARNGRIEFRDMAAQIGKMATLGRIAGLEGVEGIAQLGALTQIAAFGSKSPGEAATGVATFLNNIMGKKKVALESKYGVSLERAGGDFGVYKADLIDAVFRDANLSSKAEQGLLEHGFSEEQIKDTAGLGTAVNLLEVRGMRTLTADMDVYLKALRASGRDHEKARQAVIDFFNTMKGSEADIQSLKDQQATAQTALSAKLSAAWDKVAQATDPLLEPLGKMVDQFGILADNELPAFVESLSKITGVITDFMAMWSPAKPKDRALTDAESAAVGILGGNADRTNTNLAIAKHRIWEETKPDALTKAHALFYGLSLEESQISGPHSVRGKSTDELKHLARRLRGSGATEKAQIVMDELLGRTSAGKEADALRGVGRSVKSGYKPHSIGPNGELIVESGGKLYNPGGEQVGTTENPPEGGMSIDPSDVQNKLAALAMALDMAATAINKSKGKVDGSNPGLSPPKAE